MNMNQPRATFSLELRAVRIPLAVRKGRNPHAQEKDKLLSKYVSPLSWGRASS